MRSPNDISESEEVCGSCESEIQMISTNLRNSNESYLFKDSDESYDSKTPCDSYKSKKTM